MQEVEPKIPEVLLTDMVGNSHLLQVRLPLVIVEGLKIYEFPDTASGQTTGNIFSDLVEKEDHYISVSDLKKYDSVHMSSVTRAVKTLNKLVIRPVGFMPFVAERGEDKYSFAGLRIETEETLDSRRKISEEPVEKTERKIKYEDDLQTPIERRLNASGIDVSKLSPVERRVVDSLRGRSGTHVDIEALTRLMDIDHNLKIDEDYIVKVLSGLFKKHQEGLLPKVQFRMINGDLRVQWSSTEVLAKNQKEFNQKPQSVDGVSRIPNSWHI